MCFLLSGIKYIRAAFGNSAAVFIVLRLPTLLKMSYEPAKKRAEPYTKIVEELPQTRSDLPPVAVPAAM
ncbi:hypothetical protein AYO43_03585 [Nitrospira sp. SCGC AG-212-E16]|nr:hypothetical protein AYO43_03585 [Nitrospira sp. SCGC AG-212-E16]